MPARIDVKSKEELEKEWWDAWWEADYSWEGLKEKVVVGGKYESQWLRIARNFHKCQTFNMFLAFAQIAACSRRPLN